MLKRDPSIAKGDPSSSRRAPLSSRRGPLSARLRLASTTMMPRTPDITSVAHQRASGRPRRISTCAYFWYAAASSNALFLAVSLICSLRLSGSLHSCAFSNLAFDAPKFLAECSFPGPGDVQTHPPTHETDRCVRSSPVREEDLHLFVIPLSAHIGTCGGDLAVCATTAQRGAPNRLTTSIESSTRRAVRAVVMPRLCIMQREPSLLSPRVALASSDSDMTHA